MTQLRLYLLGAPRVELDTKPIDLPRRKVLALLLYTALSPNPLSRDALATLLWPESVQKSARAALRRELHALNNTIGADWLVTTRDTIGLNPKADLWSDVGAFQERLAQAKVLGQGGSQPTAHAQSFVLLREASDLYQGDFLAGFTLSDCPAFDDWQFFEAESLRRDYAAALTQLATYRREQGEYDAAIDYTRRWLALDALDESVHRQLMQLYALAGQQAAAVRQYDECVRILDEELGVPVDGETEQLYEAIRTRQFPAREQVNSIGQTIGSTHGNKAANAPTPVRTTAVSATEMATPTPTQLRHNLPTQATSFVGRDDELAAICRILCEEHECRLLTLVGPGGIGKTRLAVQVAQKAVDMDMTGAETRVETMHYIDGVYFVPLEAAHNDAQIITAIADAVGFAFQGNASAQDQLLNYLQTKAILLVLDNVEHLLNEVELFSHILQQAPTITILTTSREALALQEEWLYVVNGFVLPPQGTQSPSTLAEIEHNNAVQLFVQRARRADSSLTFDREALVQIARICHLVDGLPLGLELAATWVRTLSIQEIADEIAVNLDFLTTTRRGMPERHSSLRTVLEQTWKLLTAAEQDAFCRLSIFHNGFTRQAANRVADASMLLLAALVRKSIINHNREQRYTMHGLLRQFAAARLRKDPAMAEIVAEKHGRYYGLFLQTVEDELMGDTQTAALAQVGQELENIRRGWRWLLAAARSQQNIQQIDQYVDTLFHFYDTRSRFQEGFAEFHLAVEHLESSTITPETQLVLGRIRGRLGWFAFQTGRPITAQEHLQQSIIWLRELEANADLIFSLNYLGAIQRHLGQYTAAKSTLDESRQLCQECNDRFGLTVALNILGQIAYEQQVYEHAADYLQESLALKETIGDRRGTTFSLLYLGMVANAQADHAVALRYFQQSKLISEEYGDRRGIAFALSNMADVEATTDHLHEAYTLYAQSLAIYEEIYNLPGVVTNQIKLGTLARQRQDLAAARQHYTTALAKADELQPVSPAIATHLSQARAWLEEYGKS